MKSSKLVFWLRQAVYVFVLGLSESVGKRCQKDRVRRICFFAHIFRNLTCTVSFLPGQHLFDILSRLLYIQKRFKVQRNVIVCTSVKFVDSFFNALCTVPLFLIGRFSFSLRFGCFSILAIKQSDKFRILIFISFCQIQKDRLVQKLLKKDQKAFLIVLGPFLTFFSIYTFYPLFFQNYLTSYKHYKMKYPLTQYLIKRMVFGLQTYSFVFILCIQIVLNYLTKSCNSIPWIWITVALMAEMTNNVSVPVMDLNIQVMLYLKEDLCIFVIILQKLCYKANLPLGQMDVHLKPDPNENDLEIKFQRARLIKTEEVLRQQKEQTLRHNVIENETTDILEQKMRTLQDYSNNIIIHEFEDKKSMTRKED